MILLKKIGPAKHLFLVSKNLFTHLRYAEKPPCFDLAFYFTILDIY